MRTRDKVGLALVALVLLAIALAVALRPTVTGQLDSVPSNSMIE
jgi:hypothetical protein